jgi:hypothetical protein
MVARRVYGLLEERGPMTGGELRAIVRADPFELWKACRSSGEFDYTSVGRRYMRLDERLPGLARLSPSILREFLTYSVISLKGQAKAAEAKACDLRELAASISEMKAQVAKAMISKVMASLADGGIPTGRAAFILAGDVVYGMAHEEPRPERSTGKIVRGSDIDIVAIAEDSSPDAFVEGLEAAIFREKYLILSNPRLNQEIDFVVKRVSRVREQTGFDTFKRKVACKIMREGVLIDGDERIFAETKALLDESGVSDSLRMMDKRAEEERMEAMATLLGLDELRDDDGLRNLFYSSDESEEFE